MRITNKVWVHANDIAVSQPVAKSGAANFQNAAKAQYPLLQAILHCGTSTIDHSIGT